MQGGDALTAVYDTYVLMHCMEENNPYPGLAIQIAGNNGLQMNLYGYAKTLVDLATLKAGKRRFAVQFFDNKIKGISYNGNYFTGNKENDYASEITNYTPTVDKSLLLGGYQTSDGVKGRYFDGVLSQCIVYDKVLTGMQMYTWITGA